MVNIEKTNLVYKKNLSQSFFYLIMIVIAIGCILFVIYKNKIQDTLKEEAKVTLENVSAQNTFNVRMNISDRQKTLSLIAQKVQDEEVTETEKIIELLRKYSSATDYSNVGVVNTSGIAYTIKGETLDLSKTGYFTQGMKGIGGLSTGYLSEDEKEILIIITAPIYVQDEVRMLLIAGYEPSHFTRLIDIPSFDGKGKAIIINSEGEIITMANDPREIDINLLREHIKKHHFFARNKAVNTHCDERYLEYEVSGNKYLAYHEELNIYDWSLISYVPKEVVYKNLNVINIMMSNVMIFTGISICVLILVFLKQYIKYQRNIVESVCTDELTNLKNSEYMKEYFKTMKEKDKVNQFLAVIDIDKFKSINIMYGSCVGDGLLKYMATIYQELLPKEKLFRCESDIFVGIVAGKTEEEVTKKLRKIQNRLQEDIDRKYIIPIKLSFGVCALEAFDDLHSIYTNALICKNKAKNYINNKICFFNQKEQDRLIENRKIEAEFIDAVKNDEFEVWYQPKYDMKTNELYGAEALVRWRQKDGKYILPSKFIPIFEKSGQIIELDKLVIELTFKHIQSMKQLGLTVKPISINLSRVHEERSDIISCIKELVDYYKIEPKEVSFEITESALVENSGFINKIISELHHMGFQVDIDDFGIGTSTLNVLYAEDFDTLKLDRSFINHIGDPKMNSIIKSTIKMAQALHMEIIAEGVETKEQIHFLLDNGCELAQGYYFSKPLKEDEYINECLKKEP